MQIRHFIKRSVIVLCPIEVEKVSRNPHNGGILHSTLQQCKMCLCLSVCLAAFLNLLTGSNNSWMFSVLRMAR